MRKKKVSKVKQKIVHSDAYWLNLVQKLIGKHSGEARKSGKHKGHAETNTSLWIADLEREVTKYIKKMNKGNTYDGNMAVARLLGRILVVWYCTVHRAKSYDPNRPLERAKANKAVTVYRGCLMAAISDDELMGEVFGNTQHWNFPFGKGAYGGKFV